MCNIKNFERELTLHGKANSTISQYSKQFQMFIEYFKDSDIRYISESEIKDYLLVLNLKYKYSSIVHAIATIEFYYLNLNSRKRVLNLPRPKKGSYLPEVLSIEEVKLMINSTDNIKHKCIIEMLFTHGLRRQELIDLKLGDIDSTNMILRVKDSKGSKDRNIPLNKECLVNLRKYWKKEKPKKFLFEGSDNIKYSATSIYNIVKNTANSARINKSISPHSLRHSFASYLVKMNINLAKISEWLGHRSTKTTEIYTHIFYECNPIRL